jgi:IS30 family transposase
MAWGFNQGTMTRALSRNKGPRGYRVQHAPRNAPTRQEQVRHKPHNLTLRVRRALARTLWAERWTPEPISCWLQAERGMPLSHEWIDRMIWENKRTGDDR